MSKCKPHFPQSILSPQAKLNTYGYSLSSQNSSSICHLIIGSALLEINRLIYFPLFSYGTIDRNLTCHIKTHFSTR